jgi:hypothetical protein
MTRQRICATSVVMMLAFAAVGCGHAASQPPSNKTLRFQAPAQDTASYAVSNSELPPRCARRELNSVPANAWAPTRSQLAPLGAVAVRLCRYGALPGVSLQHSRLFTTPSLLKRLVADFDRLPRPPLKVNCPEDVGSEVVAHFYYHGGHSVTVSVGLTGCVLVSNGNLLRSASGFGAGHPFGPEVLAELQHLV